MTGELLRFPSVRSDYHPARTSIAFEWLDETAPLARARTRTRTRQDLPPVPLRRRADGSGMAILTGAVALLLGGGSVWAAIALPWY
ncbi:MAG TPA: hypothetical protein VIL55_08605 [Naasia sp.]|jgi:hypothetical protein